MSNFKPDSDEYKFLAKGNDPYKILGVSQDASVSDIKKAFSKIAMENHSSMTSQLPDKEREERAQLFKKALEAHALLTDADKRAQYDENKEFFDSFVNGKPPAPVVGASKNNPVGPSLLNEPQTDGISNTQAKTDDDVDDEAGAELDSKKQKGKKTDSKNKIAERIGAAKQTEEVSDNMLVKAVMNLLESLLGRTEADKYKAKLTEVLTIQPDHTVMATDGSDLPMKPPANTDSPVMAAVQQLSDYTPPTTGGEPELESDSFKNDEDLTKRINHH